MQILSQKYNFQGRVTLWNDILNLLRRHILHSLNLRSTVSTPSQSSKQIICFDLHFTVMGTTMFEIMLLKVLHTGERSIRRAILFIVLRLDI